MSSVCPPLPEDIWRIIIEKIGMMQPTDEMWCGPGDLTRGMLFCSIRDGFFRARLISSGWYDDLHHHHSGRPQSTPHLKYCNSTLYGLSREYVRRFAKKEALDTWGAPPPGLDWNWWDRKGEWDSTTGDIIPGYAVRREVPPKEGMLVKGCAIEKWVHARSGPFRVGHFNSGDPGP